MAVKQKGGGARKIGRGAKLCERYRLENRRFKNKRKRLLRHLKRQPNDAQSAKALAAL